MKQGGKIFTSRPESSESSKFETERVADNPVASHVKWPLRVIESSALRHHEHPAKRSPGHSCMFHNPV
jgi:hypothetical protein